MREPLEYWQQAVADLVRAINGTEIDFEGVTDPAATAIHDLQRERSAIRALVQQWREEAEEMRLRQYNATIWKAVAFEVKLRADQLAVLCPPAPTEADR